MARYHPNLPALGPVGGTDLTGCFVPGRDRHVLFDHDGLDTLVPAPPAPTAPSPDKLRDLARRFSAAASVGRVADELLMLQVIWVLRWILYDAYVESNRPLPRTGLKHLTAKLSDAQRATFVGLPTSGDPAPVIAALEEALGQPTWRRSTASWYRRTSTSASFARARR